MFRILMLLLLINAVFQGCKSTVPEKLPASAYIQDLAIDPSNPAIVYAATIGAGLFRSTDAGESWVEINLSANQKAWHVVEIHPHSPDTIFAGGKETGLWISEDLGASWRQIGLAGITLCDLAIDPTQPQRFFALTPEGIYRTRDLGRRWDFVFDYLSFQRQLQPLASDSRPWPFTRFQKIAINPHQPETIFAGARWEGGYHRSDDGGETWQHASISGIFRRVDPILFHPNDPQIISVGTHHQGLFKSFNGGKSWISLSRGLEPQVRTPYYGAFLISGLAPDPTNPDVFYSGSDYDNWKTTDGGISWQRLGNSLTCEFARVFAVNPVEPNIVFAGTNVGIFKSTDAGATWRAVNSGFPTVPIREKIQIKIDEIPFEFALTREGPVLYRRNLATDTVWTPVSWCLPGKPEKLEFDSTRQELVIQISDSLFRSTDAGNRWQPDRIQFAAISTPAETAPFSGNRSEPTQWTLDVEISGKVFFTDSLVEPYYQRPPYISLQLVTPDYPEDRSTPLWSANWDRDLKGTIQIPRHLLKDQEYLLYLEVRDFQRNTLVGYARVHPASTQNVKIEVDPNTLLPGLLTLKHRRGLK